MNLQPNSIILKKVLDFTDINIEHVESSLNLDSEQIIQVKDYWQEIVFESNLRGGKVWDAVTYRFEDINPKTNLLKLSKIKYSTRRGLEKYRINKNEFKSIPNSQGLFVASLLKTKDGKFIFGRKKTIDSYKHGDSKITLIGGVCSFDEIRINTGNDLKKVLQNEIEEEVGISSGSITSSKILGLTIGKHSNVGCICLTNLDLNQTQILKSFHANSDDEIDSLIFLDEEEMLKMLRKHSSYPSLIPKLLD